jgi:chemotaxis protein histidine kinase CheA
MEDFQQHFLSESANKLQDLIADLTDKENFSDSDKSAIFRALHTIKGTSQAFGLNISSRLVHELENLLSTKTQENNQILIEGFKLLKESFERKDFEFPDTFAEKINEIAPSKNKPQNFDSILAKLPTEIFPPLSSQEKNALNAELEKSKNLFCIEIGYEFSNFSAGLKNFREVLSNSGEIIATFPSQKFSSQSKIGFQILFASSKNSEQIKGIAKDFAAEIIFDSSPKIFRYDLQGILEQIVSHGKTVAENLRKSVEFEVYAEKFEISDKNLKLIFDSLIHLIRNAIDHAFETSGKIKIELESKENDLFIKVSDDGRGIDLNKIKVKGIEKNLIEATEKLSDEATLELIFQSEFSTAPKVSEISGRGVGLDAVKNAVEEADGIIKVESKLNVGTSFEILLPK